MFDMPFIKLYTADFTNGTRALTPVQFTAYMRLLVAIYDHGGPLTDDIEKLADITGLSPADTATTLQQLLKKGKLHYGEDEQLHNRRADIELERWARKHERVQARATPATQGASRATHDAPTRKARHPPARTREPALEVEVEDIGGEPPISGQGEPPRQVQTRARAASKAPQQDAAAVASLREVSSLPPQLPTEPESARADLGYSTASTPAKPKREPKPPKEHDSAPRRRTNDWDLPPAPGPRGQTAFLRRWAEANGDPTKLHGFVAKEATAQPIAERNTIRRQLGMQPLEDDDNAAQPQADAHNVAELPEPEQPQSGQEFAADPATATVGDREGHDADREAGNADPPKQDDADHQPMAAVTGSLWGSVHGVEIQDERLIIDNQTNSGSNADIVESMRAPIASPTEPARDPSWHGGGIWASLADEVRQLEAQARQAREEQEAEDRTKGDEPSALDNGK